MKSKKTKGASPSSAEEDSNHHKGAFSFIKNRFFSGSSNTSSNSHSSQQQHNVSSPRPSTSSTRSAIVGSKPWSIDSSKHDQPERPLSRSFEENSTSSDFNTSLSSSSTSTTRKLLSRATRPMSMMGMDSLLAQSKDTNSKSNKKLDLLSDASTPIVTRRRNSTTSSTPNTKATAEKRTSLIVVKEGYLFKKTDFKPFHKQTKLDRGWKLYRVLLRGHKLYLYKLTSESPLRSLFPTPNNSLKQLHHYNHNSQPSLNLSTSNSSLTNIPSTLKITRSDFDREAQQVFFATQQTAQGAIFMELNQVTMQPRQQMYLITLNDMLYICIRPSVNSLWEIYHKAPIHNLKADYMTDNNGSPASPASFSSMQSDPLSNSHSGGLLLFSISYLNRPSILGVYSTHHRELGQAWINNFQHVSTVHLAGKHTEYDEEEEDLSSSRSTGSLWREEEGWEDNNSRMYNATQKADLIYRNDRSDSIKGGTVNALVRELLRTEDTLYTRTFLLTYSTFTTGSHVLAEIKAVLEAKEDEFEMRVLDLFTYWCQHFALDVMGDVASGMMDILSHNTRQRATQVKELVLSTVSENAKKTCEHNTIVNISSIQDPEENYQQEEQDKSEEHIENITAYQSDGRRRDSVNLSNLLITGLTPAIFVEIDPKSFAQQIYLFHLSKHRQFQSDLLDPLSYLTRPQLSVQMLNSLLFTSTAPHFLTKLIRTQILIDSQQEQTTPMLTRSQLLEHWIRVGVHLLELGDMTGWCAVAMGVCSVGIVRLRETWKAVNRELVKHVQTKWVSILTEHGLFAQSMWSEEWRQEPMLSQFSKVLTSNHGLPFFGTIRQSVDRYRKHNKKLLSPTMVNFEECYNIYYTITNSLEQWKEQQQQQPLEDSSFPAVGPLQSFFEHSVTDPMSVPHDYKYLQECSLACEPRIFGQGFDRRKFSGRHQPSNTQAIGSNDVAPPSIACLTFPNILNSCSLMHSKPGQEATPVVGNHSSVISFSPTSSISGTIPASTITTTTSTAAPVSIASSQQQQTSYKKTHPRKSGSNNSIRSIRSFLESAGSSSNSNSNGNNSSSSSSSSSADPAQSTATTDSNTDNNGNTASPSEEPKRKAFQRTYSFPPGSENSSRKLSTSSKYDLIESENSRTWLGSLISNRSHKTYSTKALIEAHRKSRMSQYGHNGEFFLNVQQGELVFKISAFLKAESLNTAVSSLKRTESNYSIDFLKKDDDESQQDSEKDALLINVKAGYLEQLVETLVRGTQPHEDALKDQWQMISLTEGISQKKKPIKIAMDEEEYISVFFVTYRIYCSASHLLDMFCKRFVDAKLKCKSPLKRKSSLILLETYFTATTDTSTSSKKTPATESLLSYDWKRVAEIQLRVLNLMLYWVAEYPLDFVDDVESAKYIESFLKSAQCALEEWRVPLQEHQEEESISEDIKKSQTAALELANLIEQRITQLREQFIRKSVSPCYDLKAIEFDPEGARGAEELYRQLTSGTQRYYSTLQLATNKALPLAISTRPRDMDAKSLMDRFSPEAILEQVDRAVRQLFSAVTLQDWIQTFDVLEAQSGDIYAWLPARKPSRTSRLPAVLAPVVDAPSSHIPSYHVAPDEVIVSDIFTAIEGARRSVVSPSAFSDDDLLLAFPGSIQYLYCMHFIIRSWVINDITAMDINSKTRVLRIEKFTQIVMLSKVSSEKLALFPELKETAPKNTRVPGFVEYAIASALVSPEVRIFTKAWQDVAMQHGHASLDTLESLLSQIQKIQSLMSSSNPARTSTSFYSISSIASSQSPPQQLVVPSLGWIFERVIELCFQVPDTFENKDSLINFDKRRYLHQFMQSIMQVQTDLHEQQVDSKGLSMSFLLSPNNFKSTWKDLREMAVYENKKGMSGGSSTMGLRSSSSKSLQRGTVFHKLIAEQMEKLKKDFKERDRIDKEWLTLQHKLQKKQLEQARLVEKQDRKSSISGKSSSNSSLPSGSGHGHSVMPRINSFLRGLRPQSMVISPIQSMLPSSFSADASSQYLSTTKASTVINLIHSTTSVASTYTKREFVFRIVTEEGGQYLFQGMNREDMHDWMQHINNSAREGAAKRQSVLAADSMDNNEESQHHHTTSLVDNNRSQPASRTSVYGVSLENLMRDGKVPLVVEKCVREIERRGLEEVGIYRVAGTGSIVSALKAEFNKDVNKVDLSDPAWADINVVADALKQFLRELPEPLLTYAYYDEFIKASASEDHDERVYLIKKVIKKLPYCNYVLLKKIVEHFVIVTDFEATNHMYATNLAIVFGPTLLQPTPGPASFATTMSNLGHHQNIVKYLILNYHYLFDVESDEVEPMPKDEGDEA